MIAYMKLKKTLLAAIMLIALTACKNNVKETAEIIDLPRAETPDSVAKAMDAFFGQAEKDSMDIHSVMIVRNGNVIYSRWRTRVQIRCPMCSILSVRRSPLQQLGLPFPKAR